MDAQDGPMQSRAEPLESVPVGLIRRAKELLPADRQQVCLVVGAIGLLMYGIVAQLRDGNIGQAWEQPAVADTQFVVNINSADWPELTHLPGIGPTLARRIVEYRCQHGPFASVDRLVNVSGIGTRTVERLRQFAVTGPTFTRKETARMATIQQEYTGRLR